MFEVENKSVKLKIWKNSFRCKQPDRDNQNKINGESIEKNNNNSQAKNPDSDPSVLRGVEMRRCDFNFNK